jgi:phosphoribosyl-ATP pyrophosphohydrolase
MSIADRLYELVRERRRNPTQGSYVCSLLAQGEDRILQKLGEEAVETILAAKTGSEEALVSELADLAFHALVLLGEKGIPPRRVEAELERRFGTSGLTRRETEVVRP